MTWRAHLQTDPVHRFARLLLVKQLPGADEVLMENGTWVRFAHTEYEAQKLVTPDGVEPGIQIPHDPALLEALLDLLMPLSEKAAAAKAELAATKEALEHERGRVDDVLDRLLLDARTT